MSKRFLIILAVMLIAFVGFVVFSKKANNEDSAGSRPSNNVYGKTDSPVVLTEFVDFQCEACYAYYPHFKQVKEKYKDQVRFEVRYFPITSGHQFAMQAARSAEAAARQGKFWEMHDQIFQGQKVWERATDPQEHFNQYATTIGLDMAKFEADRTSSDVNSVINKDLSDVQASGGTGTPTFWLNGKKIENPGPSVDALSKVIEDALKEAGITPKPADVQPTSGGASQSPASGSDLAPGETQEQHDQESQQGQ